MDLAIVAVGVLLILLTLAISRRNRLAVKSRAATVNFVIDDEHVSRTLADGREESICWADLEMIEVVATPVKTADGATSFVLLYESEESGVLVPLGVGFDDDFLKQVTKLPGFSLAKFEALRNEKAPHREVCWNSPTSAV